MKTNNILENIIKSVLLESVIDAVPRTATDKEYAIGKAAGMNAVFAVLVVGKPSSYNDLLNSVGNAIESSSETIKYADNGPKPCVYIILNQADIKPRRQRLIVGVKLLEKPFKTTFINPTAGVDYAIGGYDTIGNERAPLFFMNRYKEFLAQQDQPGYGSREQHYMIGDVDYLERENPNHVQPTNPVDLNTTNNVETPAENVIGKYPYEWKSPNGIKTTVYTLSDSDEWIYTIAPGVTPETWYKSKKSDFEAHYNDNDLNDLFIEMTPTEVTDIKTKLKL